MNERHSKDLLELVFFSNESNFFIKSQTKIIDFECFKNHDNQVFSLLFCYLLHIKCNFTTYYYSTTTYEEKLKKTSLIKKKTTILFYVLLFIVY